MLACTASYDRPASFCPADFNRCAKIALDGQVNIYQQLAHFDNGYLVLLELHSADMTLYANYLRDDYARGILEERQQADVTVTAAVFSPCGQFLICASDSGRLALWVLAPYLTSEAWSGPQRPDQTPDLSFQADESCINSLAFAEDFLLCGGDESLFGWPLSELVRAMETGEAPRAEPTLCIRCPQGKLRRGGLLPFPEINDVSYDQATKRVICAAGDAMAHEWDLQSPTSPVCSYQGHEAYLHAVAISAGSALVATASEDGTVGLWDRRLQQSTPFGNGVGPCRRSTAVGFLAPARAKAGDSAGGKALARKPGGKSGEQEATAAAGGGAWVSTVELDDGGHTLVCGGGSGGGVGSAWDAAGGRGWMSQWNLATRTAIRGTSLPAEIQCIMPSDDSHTLAIGSAEPVVNYFNRSRLERRSRTPVTPKTVYALGINNGAQNSGVTCVAGSGPWINICTLPGIVGFSLYFV